MKFKLFIFKFYSLCSTNMNYFNEENIKIQKGYKSVTLNFYYFQNDRQFTVFENLIYFTNLIKSLI